MPMRHMWSGGLRSAWAIGPGRERPESGREALACAGTRAWRGPGCSPLTGTHHRTSLTAHLPRPVLKELAPRDAVPVRVRSAGRRAVRGSDRGCADGRNQSQLPEVSPSSPWSFVVRLTGANRRMTRHRVAVPVSAFLINLDRRLHESLSW